MAAALGPPQRGAWPNAGWNDDQTLQLLLLLLLASNGWILSKWSLRFDHTSPHDHRTIMIAVGPATRTTTSGSGGPGRSGAGRRAPTGCGAGTWWLASGRSR
eukprot:SAG22_NODE_138_length_18031_cov_5.796621_4_plen_102_part_00